jgi:curved DNA-binding protein
MLLAHYKCHYQRLNVAKSATQKELNQSYRNLAKKCHPDRVGPSPLALDSFLALQESYELLSDPHRRRAYDQSLLKSYGKTRSASRSSRSRRASPNSPKRAAKTKSAATPVHDSKLDSYSTLEITLNDAIVGKQTTIKIKPASPSLSTRTRIQRIIVPPMCYEGQHIKLEKKGRISSNGLRIGHLFLRIKYAKNSDYKVNGIHLHHSFSLEPWDAATGACLSLPTPGGQAELRIPPGTNHWQSFVLPGHGMPGKDGHRGNLTVVCQIKRRPAESPKQKLLWKALRDSYLLD